MFCYVLVQHLICNQGVTGSIPVGGTKFPNDDNGLACCRRFHFVSRKVINSYKQIFGVRVWGSRWRGLGGALGGL
jgi:hypothetical protein